MICQSPKSNELMAKRQSKIRSLVTLEQLRADGGSVFKDPRGHWRTRRLTKFIFAGGVWLVSLLLAYASLGLPFPGKVSAARAEASSIYARDGTTLLYKIRGDKNRTAIAFDQMPKCIKDATVATEDKSFYKHQGLDPRGLGRAILVNFETGGTTQGGSTITQQLVKNALLSPDRTVTRKAKELILSLEIEQMFSKNDILHLYLNEIPYGNNAYGIEAAAQTYFTKDARGLTLSECSTLAAMPRAPTFYSPYNSPDPNRLKNRSKFVLDRMAEEKMITPEQTIQAKAEIDGGLQFAAARGEDIKAPHFVLYVREQLEKKYGTKVTQEGGLNVVTTLDIDKQNIAEDVIKDAARTKFAGYGASNAALTSIDPKTGQILAMVGSVDYFDTAHDGNVNVATAERQPGSSFKPVVYLAGFKKGYDPNLHLAYNPATLLWDVKTDFGGGYAPNNYDQKFRGPVSARDALQQSLNVPSVKMLDLVGIGDALGLAHQLGITTLNDPDRYGDSLVLGGGEVKLVDLTSAYAVLANQGTAGFSTPNANNTRTTNTAILQVKDAKNKVLDKYDDSKKQEVVSKDLAFQITDVLTDDRARAPQFGRNSALTLAGRDAAAKTGTTDSFRDAWTVGYTPQLAAGVWLGNNDNSPMNRVGGSLGAAPIWQAYMERTLANQPAAKFDRPAGIKDVKVDKLTGLLPSNKSTGTKSEIFTDGNAPRDKNTATSGSDQGCKPDVAITSPGNGQTVDGTITIQARATGDQGVKSVEFSWDGQAIGTTSAPPFSVRYTVKNSGGSHTITAKATGDCETAVNTSDLHSERPTNPNWENPVQAYLKSHKISVNLGDETKTESTATSSISVNVAPAAEEPVTMSLSCDATHVCTATSTGPLTNVILVNSADPSDTVGMGGSGATFTGTAPVGWTGAYAQGKDSNGNTVKSSTKTLSLGDSVRLVFVRELAYLRDDQYL